MRGYGHAISSTVALAGPTGGRPNPDPLPLYSVGEGASQLCAVVGGHLSHAAEVASLSHGLVLRESFFLLVRWRPPCVATRHESLIALMFV